MTTLASRIRELAVANGYWNLEEHDRRMMRAAIVRELRDYGCTPAAVLNTLKRSPKLGRPRLDTTHCSRCGQPLPSHRERPESAPTPQSANPA